MVNYNLGKIYKIVCNTTGLVYIGSTCEPTLARRIACHRSNYNQYLKGKHNNVTSFTLLEKNNYEIVLIENYPCENKDELHKKERFYIESMICVNKVIPSRQIEEYKETEIFKNKRKEYREINKDKIKDYKVQHKEESLKYNKEYNVNYRIINKEIIKEKNKLYREKKKQEKIQTEIPL